MSTTDVQERDAGRPADGNGSLLHEITNRLPGMVAEQAGTGLPV
jgi:hypothetical protein